MQIEVKRKVCLSETDATGLLYFTNLLKYAVETFEILLEEKGVDLSLEKFLFPIVETKSNYFMPLKWRDHFTIILSIEEILQSSMKVVSKIKKGSTSVGEVTITHVLVDKESGKSTPFTQEMRALLLSPLDKESYKE